MANYVTQMSKSGGSAYKVMDEEARQSISDEAAARTQADSDEAAARTQAVQSITQAITAMQTDIGNLQTGLESNTNKSLIERGYLTSSDDINDVKFTKAGQWILTQDVSPLPNNWPLNTYGRLISFGSDSNNQAIRAQIVIGANNDVVFRYVRGASFNSWRRLCKFMVSADPEGEYNDVDTFPLDSAVNVASANYEGIAHFPTVYHTGAIVFTLHSMGNCLTGYTGAIQLAFFYNASTYAYRVNTNDTWRDWHLVGVFELKYRCVAQSTGESNTFANLAWGIRYMMQRFNDWNEYYRCLIEIEPGTFSLGSVVDYVRDGTVDIRGLFLPPYCTLKGAGKDKTFINFDYNGSDETLMFNVSGLNIPYESVMEDLTLSVKNLRYTVHSDNGMTTMPDITVDNTKLLNNNQITLRNVRLIHKGFDEGKHGTDPATGNSYTVPSCWGSGSYNNANQSFYDCEMIATQCTPFLNHNRASLTVPSKFVFERCQFVNGNEPGSFSLGNNYTSLLLISWGSHTKDSVDIIDCFFNRFITLSIRTDMGNADAICDYNVFVNTPTMVAEYSNNDSHLLDNYFTANCKPEMASGTVVAYKPVSKTDIFGRVHAYNSSDSVVGIALNSANNNSKVTVQYKGLVYLDLLKSGGFAPGTNIGYNGTNWVEDNVHPIVKALEQHVGKLIQEEA